jgi:hypothetical protein
MGEKEPGCARCGHDQIFTKCLGCDMPLCESCSRFELIGSGCGCVWPAYYCPACAVDPHVNPNAMFRDPETKDGGSSL